VPAEHCFEQIYLFAYINILIFSCEKCVFINQEMALLLIRDFLWPEISIISIHHKFSRGTIEPPRAYAEIRIANTHIYSFFQTKMFYI